MRNLSLMIILGTTAATATPRSRRHRGDARSVRIHFDLRTYSSAAGGSIERRTVDVHAFGHFVSIPR
jgi:hypothetical protein